MSFGYTEPSVDKPAGFALLAEVGATKAVVHFCGGGDEGGADGIEFFNAEGQKLAVDADWQDMYEDGRFGALTTPVYEAYGSFAGEFYVDGTVTWDAATQKVSRDETYEEMQGQEGHYDY